MNMIKYEYLLDGSNKSTVLSDAITLDGVEFIKLSNVNDTPETRKKLYELVKEGVIDDPGQNGIFETFDQFSKKIFGHYWKNNKTQFLATYKGEWIGLCSITIDKEKKVAKCGLTVVKKRYRGYGIASYLKNLSIDYCRSEGLLKMVTEVDESNYPMMKINQQNGFKRVT
ncbi:Acetyltransferase (GNAT) domain-containing protein [Seinonella peptonophila]|uniref:Acetyltransferase (GNAT) domain-containing protein n=1 Tax=Seinonella peptonophila TaxID=112248 RepID=A0A1M4ZY86_9BACL|nr:GNAT family N-acetyltransferase [Seinonella peptonophila]SHF22662.1 Acetyltransferase (GNAT) domain-containing protein [Seinonella peptonophila]